VRVALVSLALALGTARAATAQVDVHRRLSGRLGPDVLAAVERIADSAAARHLPVEPIVEKASEGAMKGVAADRLVAAASVVLHQLTQSATAIRAGGVSSPEPDAINAGAVAINAGLSPADVQAVVQRTRAPYTPAATLRVAATLAALGVPGAEAVDLVGRAVNAHQVGEAALLDLPRQVQAEMGSGSSAAEAAEHIGHTGGGGGSGEPGAPSAHGPPTSGHSHKP